MDESRLTTCRTGDGKIAIDAVSCPHCGTPDPASKSDPSISDVPSVTVDSERPTSNRKTFLGLSGTAWVFLLVGPTIIIMIAWGLIKQANETTTSLEMGDGGYLGQVTRYYEGAECGLKTMALGDGHLRAAEYLIRVYFPEGSSAYLKRDYAGVSTTFSRETATSFEWWEIYCFSWGLVVQRGPDTEYEHKGTFEFSVVGE
ncbi:hypothetical protein H8D29_06785 [PVC group bacterium]|nr:hypothetical protein [PVC group bacterium]